MVQASQNGDITESEAEQLIRYNGIRYDSLLTDVFDEHLQHAQERDNPHSLENAVHKLTNYAQLNSNAAAKNTPSPAHDEAATGFHEQTGDANPNHGYEEDGDVEMRSEQDTVRETTEQTDFTQAHPEEEALKHRHRDAETTLNERMSYNHRRWDDLNNNAPNNNDQHNNDTASIQDSFREADNTIETTNMPEAINKPAETRDHEVSGAETDTWQDGLRRSESDESDKV